MCVGGGGGGGGKCFTIKSAYNNLYSFNNIRREELSHYDVCTMSYDVDKNINLV